MPEFIFTHPDQLIDIQEIAIQRNHSEADKGLEGRLREGAGGILAFIIEQPGWEPALKSNVIKYSAFVLHTIATQHPFVQANKRTAFAAAENCLLICNMKMDAGDEEVEKFMLEVANDAYSIGQVEEWIRNHTVAIKKMIIFY